jgi:hypothetical protein
MFVPNPHALTAPPISHHDILAALDVAAVKGRESAVKRLGDSAVANWSRRDFIIADSTVALRESLGIRSADAVGAAGVRSFMLNLHGLRAADAASTVPEANTFVAGPPVKPIFRPTRLMDEMPAYQLPIWTDTVRVDYLDYTGQIQWGRGGDTSMPISDYTVASEFWGTPEIAWTSTNLHWVQEQRAQSPNYAVSPSAEKANAAKVALDQALESALVSTPAGIGFRSIANTPMLRGSSALVYGTDAVQDCLQDFTRFLQRIGELSLGIFAPDTAILTQRVVNRLSAPVTTSGAFPFDPGAQLRSRLAEYGISRVIIAPSMQDAGGTNIDRCLLIQSGPGGLKRYTALDPVVVRTSVIGLNTQTIMAALPAGVYSSYRASSFAYDIEVTPAG